MTEQELLDSILAIDDGITRLSNKTLGTTDLLTKADWRFLLEKDGYSDDVTIGVQIYQKGTAEESAGVNPASNNGYQKIQAMDTTLRDQVITFLDSQRDVEIPNLGKFAQWESLQVNNSTPPGGEEKEFVKFTGYFKGNGTVLEKRMFLYRDKQSVVQFGELA